MVYIKIVRNYFKIILYSDCIIFFFILFCLFMMICVLFKLIGILYEYFFLVRNLILLNEKNNFVKYKYNVYNIFCLVDCFEMEIIFFL